MRRLSLLLALSAALAAPAAAQTVRDSVRMTLHVFQYARTTDGGFNCGGGVYATWPNVASQVLGRPGVYSDYSRVATEGQIIPTGWGEATTSPDHGITVPGDRLGHLPHWSWGVGPGPIPATCARYATSARTLIAGGWTVLNARPYRVTDWYAVFSVPNGTPIAVFEWEPDDGLAIAFDGSFESDLSHEVDVTAPRNKRPVANYAWDFGDGATGTGARPTHAYQEPGEYTVVLTVTDDDGQQNDFSQSVTVTTAHLTVEYASVTPEAHQDEEIEVVALVRNSGTETVYDVQAHRLFSFESRLPDSLNVSGSRRLAPDLPAVALADGEPPVETRAELAPGESFEVRRRYLVEDLASWRAPGATTYEPVDSVVEWDLYDVRAETSDNTPVEVRRPCLGEGCNDVTELTIEAPELTVEIELTNADGPVATAPAGRQRRRGALGQWITDHVLTRDGRSHCISGCVDVTVTVTDPEGLPVEGAEVQVGAPLVAGEGIATPDQGGGFLCTLDAVDRCARILELDPTDADGETRARYWFPGLTAPTATTFTVTAEHPDYDLASETAPLSMVPTRVDVGEPSLSLSPTRVSTLRLMEDARRFLNVPNLLVNACKSMMSNVWGRASRGSAVPMDSEFLKGTAFAADFACGNHLRTLEETIGLEGGDIGAWLTLFDAATKLAALSEVYWFHSEFGIPSVGLAVVSVASPAPPFVDMQSEFSEAINAAIARVYNAGHLMTPGGTLSVDLYETSYRRIATGGVSGEVPALHLRIRSSSGGGVVEHTALVRAGYRPGLWLTEEGVSVATVTADAAAGATSLTLTGGAGRVRIDGGVEPYAPGDVVTLDAGGPAFETVHVASVGSGTVALTAPLRHNHAAGTTTARVDSVALGPPRAPLALDHSIGFAGAPLSPTLRWVSPTPALSFDIEVATDSTFETVVSAVTVAADSVSAGPFAESVRHYWRVRATNLLGDGPWSTRYSFVPGRPAADPLGGAVDLPGLVLNADPVMRGRWTMGATTEPGEAGATCGGADGSMWFRVTAPADGRLEIDSEGSVGNVVLSAWSGTTHPLSELGCARSADDNGGTAALDLPAVAGQTVYVRATAEPGTDALAVVRAALRPPVAADPGAVPTAFALGTAHPNPTRDAATVHIDLPAPARLRVSVYDAMGREVAVVVEEGFPAGRHALRLDAAHLATGLYVIRAATDSGSSDTRRIAVVR